MDRGLFLAPDPPGVGRGARTFELVKAPAAGANWSWSAPSGYFWRPIAIFATLTASAQVANRFPGYQVMDADKNVLFAVAANNAVAAKAKAQVSIVQDLTFNAASESLVVTVPIPSLLLPANYTIEALTVGVQTEDQYSSVRLWLEQWEDRGAEMHAAHEHLEVLVRLLTNQGG